jgi:serine/threonine protein kinase/WD40 repeat protein
MPVTIGQQLGSYEITSLLGKGGMGEVYRARDSKLKREVAIKFLPDEFSRDGDRTTRFQREAELLASLNHPNIGAIYDLQEFDGARFLVLELVEGETLAERIERGPIPLADALDIAKQICEALEAAHEKGIVHRDLKPANVKVSPDGKVKVLDFGLAKAMENVPESSALSNSPTMLSGTMGGMILGTAAYMSPEQARGKTLDKRADIWAFGVMLYELLTGESLFQGEEVSDSLAAVIRKEPDLTRVPVEVRRLLHACLEKDPKNRLRDIGDVWRLLDPTHHTDRVQKRSSVLPWMIASAVMIVIAAALAFIHFRETAPEPRVVRFQIPLPDKTSDARWPSISPDGRHLAFAAAGEDGRYRIWIRDLDALESRVLQGTEGAVGGGPYWSPDSHSVAFFDGLTLKTIDISGGPPVTLGNYGLPQATWGPDGTILVGSVQGILRIPQGGGTSSLVTKTVRPKETAHSFPHFLPDGTHFIYGAISTGGPVTGGAVYVSSLRQDMNEPLIQGTSRAAYAAPASGGRPGHLIYVIGGTLMARPFDADRVRLVGDAFPISQQNEGNAAGFFSVSATGAVAYGTATGARCLQLTWFNREGRLLRTLGEAGEFTDIALSKDGKRVAFGRDDADIWLWDDAPGAAPVRSTMATGLETNPVWSPDGEQLAYSSNRDASDGLYSGYVRAVNGSGQDRLVAKGGVRLRD